MIKVKSTVTEDVSKIDGMFARLKSLEKYEVQYGYFEGDIHEASGLDFTDLVTILSEGDGVTLPPRPFMDLAYETTDRYFQVDNRWKNDIWSYLAGKGNIKSVLKQFGRIGEKHVQDSIIFGVWEENAPDWSAYKFRTYGHSIPLIETTEMLESVKSKVLLSGEMYD